MAESKILFVVLLLLLHTSVSVSVSLADPSYAHKHKPSIREKSESSSSLYAGFPSVRWPAVVLSLVSFLIIPAFLVIPAQSALRRKVPLVTFSPDIVSNGRSEWTNCLLGFLVDIKDISVQEFQEVINRCWKLQDQVKVITKFESFYILKFANREDMAFIHDKGPWAIKDRLLVLAGWRPNIIAQHIKVRKIRIWFRLEGLPLEYINSTVANALGSMLGKVIEVDPNIEGYVNTAYARVNVEIDPRKPLEMGFFLTLDDGRRTWVKCKPERTFRICRLCCRIGHVDGVCNWSREKVEEEFHRHRRILMERSNPDYNIQMNHQHFVYESTHVEGIERTTAVQVRYGPLGATYEVMDHDPLHFEPVISPPSISSESSNSYSGNEANEDAMEIDTQSESDNR